MSGVELGIIEGYYGKPWSWGARRDVVDRLAPSWANDAAKKRWWARAERLAGGPGYFKEILDLFLHTDLRPVLESIQAPTLVLHRRGDRHVIAQHARDVAERIPNARLVEFDGDDHVWFAGDADRVLDEIEPFITGSRRAAPTNRVLSTVLFTGSNAPICRSTVSMLLTYPRGKSHHG